MIAALTDVFPGTQQVVDKHATEDGITCASARRKWFTVGG